MSISNAAGRGLEMWAGLECTFNRVGNRYRDQLELTGHYTRTDDVERLAALGVRAVRYPVLWERHSAQPAAWRHTDRMMQALQQHGIEPIVGLVHHGSGPSDTSLLDAAFATRLATFAGEVANRYPWVRRYTPVNEPLTTARFAGLYGCWYPHRRDDRSFITALLNQIDAIQQSMAAIRNVTPDAELVATEDLGHVHSTPLLRYQAAFENERRWLSWDFLCGRIQPAHRLWNWLMKRCENPAVLDAIVARNGAVGSIMLGVNHYITSERFLDDHVSHYPAHLRGGNNRHAYVDIEAVRARACELRGPELLLDAAWRRYGVPVAITEAHLACTREQQLLWLDNVWGAAERARQRGADVRAVTAWSAFGAYDWGSLMTRDEGSYEPGLFDVRAPAPRPTAVCSMVRALATTGSYAHPVLASTGWWTRAERWAGRPEHGARRDAAGASATPPARPLLITGAGGTLGRTLTRLAHERGLACVTAMRDALDITNADAVARYVDSVQPWAVINAAGWVRVDDAEQHADECLRINAVGPEILARACAPRGIRFVTFSSDLVFDGTIARPYVESDTPRPLNVYGRSKAEAEQRVLATLPEALVVRTSAFFDDFDDGNFVSRSLATLQLGGTVRAPHDAIVSPTYVTDLVHTVLDLLIDSAHGIWHLANSGQVTWTELVRLAAELAGLDTTRIEACTSAEIGWHAPRPGYSVLGSERARLLETLPAALARYMRSRAWERVAKLDAQTGLEVASGVV